MLFGIGDLGEGMILVECTSILNYIFCKKKGRVTKPEEELKLSFKVKIQKF